MIALAESLAVLTSALSAAMAHYDRLDAGSPAAVLVQAGRLTRNEADGLRKLGRHLENDLPATRAGLAAGRIGVAQAKTIAALDRKLAASASPVPAEARRRVEAVLAEDAVAATTTETSRAATTARYRLDPDGAEQEMRAQRDERGITVSLTLDGTGHITGLLDSASVAVWQKYLDRMAGPASPDDMRTAAARRADAITDAFELLQRVTGTPDEEARESCSGRPAGKPYQRPALAQTGEDAADGEPGGFAWRKSSPAQLMIITSHDLLTGKPGAEPATLGDGTVIPAETARRYLCEAAVNRVVLPAGDQPLRLGRTKRLFTPMQVRAMIVRDRTCRWKGCEVPAIRCSPHHRLSWSQGGETDPINGVMLCGAHHRMTHEDGPPGAASPSETNLHAA